MKTEQSLISHHNSTTDN